MRTFNVCLHRDEPGGRLMLCQQNSEMRPFGGARQRGKGEAIPGAFGGDW
jgi:hypothetical protein